eukprot:2289258-Alexandrium_andersonii.AAC.1
MSASLVGSEMCIRDSVCTYGWRHRRACIGLALGGLIGMNSSSWEPLLRMDESRQGLLHEHRIGMSVRS